jgi:hypothetical protein
VQAREQNLDEHQRKRLSRELGLVISALEALPMDFRAQTGSDKLSGRICIFRERLLAPVLSAPTTSRRA